MTAPRQRLADIADPYFAAAKRHELVLPRCSSCDRHFFYPTVLCPHCHSSEWTWVPAGGDGVVYSFTVVHRPLGSSMPAPYVVAVVALPEGVRLMANLVGEGADSCEIGMPVRVDFSESWDGRTVPVFRPAADGAADD
jgi:uncharacterized protein